MNYNVTLQSGKKVQREMADAITARNQAEDMARRNDAWKGSSWRSGKDRFHIGPDGRIPSSEWPNGRVEVTQYDVDRAVDGL